MLALSFKVYIADEQLDRPQKQDLQNVWKVVRGGLGKWFDEKWVDVKTGKACGRKSAKGGSKRAYPACRPKKVASKISKKEASKKTGPGRVKWSTTASGRKRK